MIAPDTVAEVLGGDRVRTARVIAYRIAGAGRRVFDGTGAERHGGRSDRRLFTRPP